jgi:GTPase
VAVGDNVLIGPDSLGQFSTTSIKSIQRKRVNVDTAEAGQSVSFALKRVRRHGKLLLSLNRCYRKMTKTDVSLGVRKGEQDNQGT